MMELDNDCVLTYYISALKHAASAHSSGMSYRTDLQHAILFYSVYIALASPIGSSDKVLVQPQFDQTVDPTSSSQDVHHGYGRL